MYKYEAKIAELERIVGQLTMENALLKSIAETRRVEQGCWREVVY